MPRMSDELRPRYWETVPLEQMTPQEWEALCDGCGRCCLNKLEDIDTDELVQKLEELPPLDETSFTAKIKDILGAYTKGKDTSKLRIVVKRKDGER